MCAYPQAQSEPTDLTVELARIDVASAAKVDSAAANSPRRAFVPVYFATNRAVDNPTALNERYGSQRARTIDWGKVVVSIPPSHHPGEVERPGTILFVFHRAEDPSKHVIIDTIVKLKAAEWRDSVRRAVRNSRFGEVLAYIHGYNVPFDDAVRRAAQLGYDLGFESGVITTFSWPSKGGTADYSADEASVEASIPYVRTFLDAIADSIGARHISVVAHSMGNRALGAVLRMYAEERAAPAFAQVVLAAPDIDAQVFAEQIAPKLSKATRRATLYASEHDKAIFLSGKLHEYERAGAGGSQTLSLDGLDLVDASRVPASFWDHAYVAENKEVLDDIFMLIRHDIPPDRRNLRPLPPYSRAYMLP